MIHHLCDSLSGWGRICFVSFRTFPPVRGLVSKERERERERETTQRTTTTTALRSPFPPLHSAPPRCSLPPHLPPPFGPISPPASRDVNFRCPFPVTGAVADDLGFCCSGRLPLLTSPLYSACSFSPLQSERSRVCCGIFFFLLLVMEVEIDRDIAALDPELLQLLEISPFTLKENPQIVEHLYTQWLSLPETAKLVKSLIDDAKGGASLNVLGSCNSTNAATANLLPSMFPAGSTPPLSPRSSSGSPRVMRRQSAGLSHLGSPLKLVSEPVKEVIPQFYFHNGRPPPNELKEQCLSKIDRLFYDHLDGLQVQDFRIVTKEICKLPSFFSSTLFRRIDTECIGMVTRNAFIDYWINSNIMTKDTSTQIFLILKQPGHKYLTQDDFKPILRELLATHPGLEFLQSTPEFQERYAETVIYRIFYYINRSGNGRLTLRELKHGNLIAAMQHADEEEDINKVLRYFSYEHFYVIYCKFWELDTDHDFLIDKENLIRYGNHALTYRIVDRIFSQIPRKFTSKVEGKMGYEDFVYFMLSEEDKSSEPSLEYWFKCIDLDGNGVITPNEMQFFYEEQLHRMECMGQEPVLFEDILCQIVDMIRPEKETHLTLRDLKGCKLSGNVFNILFNLIKFMAFETRDPFLIRQERENPSLTEWDRFAHREYIRLSMEDDAEDASNGSGDVWDETLEVSY